MSETHDGGPAFPCSNEQFTHGNPQTGDAWSGLSLRDYFAARALDSIMRFGGSDMWNTDRQAPMARCAYEMADAMLAARQKGDTP